MEEVLYNIFAFLIIGFAFFIAGKKLYESIKPKKESTCSSGCSGCGTPCELKDMLQKRNANL